MPTIHLGHGTVEYRATGPEDASPSPVVFVHGFLVDATVWTCVADLLSSHGVRSYAPNLPLGAHRIALAPDADQSPRGVARQILSFIEALDLDDVTLVGNDTGGALIQFILDTDPSRIGRVVLTNCDAFDTFPPFPFNVMFHLLKGERRLKLNLTPMRFQALRHSPIGFGLLASDLDPAQSRAWIEPSLNDARVRRDAVHFLEAVEPKDLLDVAARLGHFEGPVRLVWGMADRSFKPSLGRRLQHAFTHAELVEVRGARTFVQLDAPDALAEQVAAIGSARP